MVSKSLSTDSVESGPKKLWDILRGYGLPKAWVMRESTVHSFLSVLQRMQQLGVLNSQRCFRHCTLRWKFHGTGQ